MAKNSYRMVSEERNWKDQRERIHTGVGSQWECCIDSPLHHLKNDDRHDLEIGRWRGRCSSVHTIELKERVKTVKQRRTEKKTKEKEEKILVRIEHL